MKKILLFILILPILLPISLAEVCSKENDLVGRLISNCSIKDDKICDDGEYILKDADCTITIEKIKNNEIFKEIWFAKVLILASILLYVYKPDRNKRFLAIVLILIFLLAYIPELNQMFNQNKSPIISKNITQSNQTMKKTYIQQDFEEVGSIISQKHPMLGIIVLFVILWLMLIYIPIKIKKQK